MFTGPIFLGALEVVYKFLGVVGETKFSSLVKVFAFGLVFWACTKPLNFIVTQKRNLKITVDYLDTWILTKSMC